MKDYVLQQLDEGLARMALVPPARRMDQMIRDGLIDEEGQPIYRRSGMSKEESLYVVGFPMVGQLVVSAGSKSAAIETARLKLEEILAGPALSAVVRMSGDPVLMTTSVVGEAAAAPAKAPKAAPAPKIKPAPVQEDEDEETETEDEDVEVEDDADEDEETETEDDEDEAPPAKKAPMKVGLPKVAPPAASAAKPGIRIPLIKKK